jgi:hypothetical protein
MISKYNNYPDGFIADQIGRVTAAAKTLEGELTDLKDEVKRRGIESATGDHYRIAVSEYEAERLDTKAAKEALGEALTPFMRRSLVRTVRPTAVFQQPVLED